MTKDIVVVIASAVTLSACAANYPKLMEAQAPPPAQANNLTELDHILAAAATLQASYGRGYRKTAKWNDLAQLPLIAAASAAAWVLLENKANAATDVGKIGIGAGAYSAARGQLTSPGVTDAYIAGHGALTCVLAEGSVFAGAKAETRARELDNELQKIADAIARVSSLRWQSHDPATPADTVKAITMVADQAVANARTSETAALAQLGAFNTSAPIFRNAVSAISVRVASKGRVRPAIDFATLRDSFAPPKTGNAGAVEGVHGRMLTDDGPLVERLVAATAALVTATARLSGGTPAYTQSLTRVAACPDHVK
jgi:hypothetical protein